MNILMVDDDRYVLEGLRNGVDWNRLPFDERYEARSVSEAKKILSEIPIDVLLCDIDMPQESGLDLLEWLRKKKATLQTVFLTSYADFNYAQRALQLGSFDYFLKPIAYEKLTRILLDASCKAEEVSASKTYQQYGRYWLETEDKRKEAFFSDCLHNACPDIETALSLSKSSNLNYSADDTFVIMAFHIKTDASHNWRDSQMLRYRLLCTMESPTLCHQTPSIHKEALWQENNSLWYSIYHVSGKEEEYWKQLSNTASSVRKQMSKDFTEFAVYLSQTANLCHICHQAQEISLMMFNNIIYGNGIFFVVDYHPDSHIVVLPDKEQINNDLLRQDVPALMRCIEQNIRDTACKNSEPYTASRALIAEWTQMIYLYLDKNNISAYSLFSNENYKLLYKNTINSFSDCQRYLQSMVSEALSYVKQIQQSQNLIAQVQEYIHSHLEENLSRSSLGEVFCLNADYLANTFKTATGISLMKYMNEVRLRRAYDLLLTTDEPVYAISASVGFPNSSYFSRQFRKEYGFGPSDLRNQT